MLLFIKLFDNNFIGVNDMAVIKPMAKPLRARRNLKYTLRRAPKRGLIKSQTISKSGLRKISNARRLSRINKHTTSNNSQISVAKPLMFRKNLRYTYSSSKGSAQPPIVLKYNGEIVKFNGGKRRSRIDRHILSKDPHLERTFLLDGKNEVIFDVSKERTRKPESVGIDFKKVDSAHYINQKGKNVIRDGKLLAIHTHPGINMTQVLPSFNDIRGSYIRLIYDHLYNRPYRKSLYSDYNMIVGYDTANKRISGRTIYKISESMKESWLRKFSQSSLIKDSIMIKENGRYSSVSLNEFQKQLRTHYDALTKKMEAKITDKIKRYRSKNKNATYPELIALNMQEHLHYLQRYFGVEIHFQAEPGYKLNHETFHFEKV